MATTKNFTTAWHCEKVPALDPEAELLASAVALGSLDNYDRLRASLAVQPRQVRGDGNENLLMAVTQQTGEEILADLLGDGVPLRGIDWRFMRNALHWAALRSCRRAVEFLVARGADVRDTDGRHKSPLWLAATTSAGAGDLFANDRVLRVLIAAGADLTETHEGVGVFTRIVKQGHLDLVEGLLRDGFDPGGECDRASRSKTAADALEEALRARRFDRGDSRYLRLRERFSSPEAARTRGRPREALAA